MSFIDAINKELFNKVFTENGDTAYASTGSFCLDYFSSIGGLRFNYSDIMNLFAKAYSEDPVTALKIMFYSRDINYGLGERSTFRFVFNFLCNFYPEVAKKLMKYVAEYGRYDDLLTALDTPCEIECAALIKEQLTIDIENKKEGKPISLLAKWLPSINTSKDETRECARKLCTLLDLTYAKYRQTLSFLRKDLIIENNLREMNYSFDYDKVPSQAMLKYQNAFLVNDEERYTKYIEDVKAGKTTLNTSTLFPYQIISKLVSYCTPEEKQVLDVIWKAIDRNEVDSKTIVVCDTSGSMFSSWFNPTPISAAVSLTILFAEQLKGPFKDTFITFSSHPTLITLKGKTIDEKVKEIIDNSIVENTNIERVYNLILKTAINQHIAPEDMIERIVIISDMEFDQGCDGVPTYETFKQKFQELNYKFPEIVFWNVASHTVHFPVTKDEKYVKLISGFSKNIINSIINNENINPYEFMMNVLKHYDFINNLNI